MRWRELVAEIRGIAERLAPALFGVPLRGRHDAPTLHPVSLCPDRCSPSCPRHGAHARKLARRAALEAHRIEKEDRRRHGF